MTEETWHLDPRRAPTLNDDDTLIFDEHGRILRDVDGRNGTDYRSHWFRLVKPKYGFYMLLVHHGGGEERMTLGWSRRIVAALDNITSDNRYYLLHTFYKVASDARSAGVETATDRYRKAHAEGRLKKRKMPGRDSFKVWIEPARAAT